MKSATTVMSATVCSTLVAKMEATSALRLRPAAAVTEHGLTLDRQREVARDLSELESWATKQIEATSSALRLRPHQAFAEHLAAANVKLAKLLRHQRELAREQTEQELWAAQNLSDREHNDVLREGRAKSEAVAQQVADARDEIDRVIDEVLSGPTVAVVSGRNCADASATEKIVATKAGSLRSKSRVMPVTGGEVTPTTKATVAESDEKDQTETEQLVAVTKQSKSKTASCMRRATGALNTVRAAVSRYLF